MTDTEENTESIGEKLRQAREQANLSQEDIANQLHLNLDIIKALEEDDFDNLAGPTFTRGYIRSYCKVINIDPLPLIGLYNQIEPDKTIPDAQPMVSSAHTQISSQDKPVKLVTYLICIGLVILLLIWWQGHDGGLPFMQETIEEEVVEESNSVAPAFDYDFAVVDHDAPEEVEPIVESQSPLEPTSVAETLDDAGSMMGMDESLVDQLPSTDTMLDDLASDITDSIDTEEQPASTIDEDVASSSDNTSDASTSNDETISDAEEATVLFILSKESWIEVNDVDDKRLFINLVEADSELEVKGKPPLRVLLGNSAGVKVQYQGEDFDISPYERAGIARFTLE